MSAQSTVKENFRLTWPQKTPWRDSSKGKSKSKVRRFIYWFICCLQLHLEYLRLKFAFCFGFLPLCVFRNRCGPVQKGRGAGDVAGRHGRAGRRRHADASPKHQGNRPSRGLRERLHRSPEVRISLECRSLEFLDVLNCNCHSRLHPFRFSRAPLAQGAVAVQRGCEQQGHRRVDTAARGSSLGAGGGVRPAR